MSDPMIREQDSSGEESLVDAWLRQFSDATKVFSKKMLPKVEEIGPEAVGLLISPGPLGPRFGKAIVEWRSLDPEERKKRVAEWKKINGL